MQTSTYNEDERAGGSEHIQSESCREYEATSEWWKRGKDLVSQREKYGQIKLNLGLCIVPW